MILAEDYELIEASHKGLDLSKEEGDLGFSDDDIRMIVSPHHFMEGLSELNVDLAEKAIGRANAM